MRTRCIESRRTEQKLSRRAKRRLADNIVSAHRKACEAGNRQFAHQLREALVIEVTGFGHGKEDRHRKHFEREAS